ncbi:unnamed protein product [Rotaria sordida]|uniref:Uncharacterized protein n=1 Tax=Rotaria sordida TaxID=392033 RepID=A0A814EGQ6_9BILA|nr:unnamed protein product [Rotaria sordida]CAF1030811.1 unnamed protein product [Rotaria sordida]
MATGAVDKLSLTSFDAASFHPDQIFDDHLSDTLSRVQSLTQFQPQQIPTVIDIATDERTTHDPRPLTSSARQRHRWRMTYYFYIHVAFFIISGLLSGLIIWFIENHSSLRNVQMKVAYIDAWFVSSTCVYSCGLTTLDFAKLSHPSQAILMLFTFISGVTISTLPALAIKAYTHKRVEGITVDDDHGDLEDEINDELPTVNTQRGRNLPEHIRNRLATLPTTAQLRYRAYITCIILILSTCFTIYTIGIIAIGSWLSVHYTSDQLLQGNSSVNPWYASFIITLTGFNQNGLSPFSDGLARFVHDVYLNVFVMMVVMSGTSFFPIILRNVVFLARYLVPWRHKVIFDYILLNNHRLSTLLFPTVQTRIYIFVTILLYIFGISISLILDLNSDHFDMYSPGIRFLIFTFHTVNTRFAGFSSIDINLFAAATLVVYLLLMATKPQMLCALDESPLELSWLALQAKVEAESETKSMMNINDSLDLAGSRSRLGSILSLSTPGALPLRHMERFLRRQSFVTKDLARQQFTNTASVDDTSRRPRYLRYLHIRLFFIYFIRAVIKHTFSSIVLTRTWLFFFIFLICAIEYRKMSPVDPNITVFKIIFEIISAFGTVGLTLGYPNVASSFSTVLSSASKTIIITTMLMGRHRGLLASMKDQEAIEHSAIDLLNRRREEIILEYQQRTLSTNVINQTKSDVLITKF